MEGHFVGDQLILMDNSNKDWTNGSIDQQGIVTALDGEPLPTPNLALFAILILRGNHFRETNQNMLQSGLHYQG